MGTCEGSCSSVGDADGIKPAVDCNGAPGGGDGDRESSGVEVVVEKVGGDGGDREGSSGEAAVEKIGGVDGDREGFDEEAPVQKLDGGDGDRDGSSEQGPVEKLGSVRIEGEAETAEEKGEDVGGEGEKVEGNDGAGEARETEDWRKEMGGEDQNEVVEDWKEEGKQIEYGFHYYPLRPDAENCSFYMKTGSCKFGSNCRFNHPTKRSNQVVDADSKDYDFQGTGHTNKIECKYYLTPEGCKFGDACRFSHSKEKSDAEPAELNFLGLPIRLGEKECPFYMRNGSCGYGATCRFHHPDPTASVEEPKNLVANSGSLQAGRGFAAKNIADFAPPMSSMAQLASTSSSDNLPSYVPPWMNSLPQRMPQAPVYNQYQAPGSLPDNTLSSRPSQFASNPLKKSDSYGYHQQLAQNEQYPERPGQPECEYFIKTGTCKFRSACRYHHPKDRLHSMSNGLSHNFVEEPNHFTPYTNTVQTEEYPERPGQLECAYFLKTGQCKYKSACKYHHPKSRFSKPAASMYSMNSLPSASALNLPHEFNMLPDSYPSHLKPAAQPFRQHLQQPRRVEEFPERPGQAECEYFMKTGDCKYKSACRFHHPKGSGNRASTSSVCPLNELGLPLRPGASTCRNYAQLGICKYGPRCLFDHPSNYDSSAVSQPLSPPSPPSNDPQPRGWDDGWVM